MNSIYGKCLQNIRKLTNLRLVRDAKRMAKLSKKPNMDDMVIFSDDLVAVTMRKTNIKLNRPVLAGSVILDHSKHLILDYHYNVVKKRFGNRAKLCFTDTGNETPIIVYPEQLNVIVTKCS